jgi:hypothetical protein
MGVTVHMPISGELTATIECEIEKTGSAKGSWDCCQLKQFCAKVNELNQQAANGELKDITGTDLYDANRLAGDKAAKAFREAWNSNPKMRKNPTKSKFYHECAVKKGKIGEEMQPDHVHEIQQGGPPGESNLRWLDTSVNRSIQGHVGAIPEVVTAVDADCCPAGRAYCKGKGDRASVLS